MEKIKQIIRVANTDIDGNKKLYSGLRKIKGFSFMFSNAICNSLGLDKKKPIGTLTEEEIKKIEGMVANPNLPKWLLNRPKDYDTNQDRHVVSGQLNLVKSFDIKRLQEIKSNRGLRHAWGLPLRGQRTRSNFRKGKSVGVSKKSKQPAKKKAAPASPAKSAGKGGKK